ncbi:MAG: heme o synthase [Ilumatobacteraceae bacterium]
MALTVIGGTLAAGGANAINMVVDRDIDRLMQRTQGRPLVTGAMTPTSALASALALEAAAFAVLWWGANLLSAVLALAATAFYVGVYTLWLKRTSRQNIVVGGAAGAVPVLVGWAAVRDSLGWEPIVLFAVMFLWTPPHFWALAIKYRDDYRAAGVPMLPSVVPLREAAQQMMAYTVVLVAGTLVLAPVASLSWIYTVVCSPARRRLRGAHGGPRPPPHTGDEHAGLHLQHHLCDPAVRGDRGRCVRPTRRLVISDPLPAGR